LLLVVDKAAQARQSVVATAAPVVVLAQAQQALRCSRHLPLEASETTVPEPAARQVAGAVVALEHPVPAPQVVMVSSLPSQELLRITQVVAQGATAPSLAWVVEAYPTLPARPTQAVVVAVLELSALVGLVSSS
jgi:hypothetical protein